MIGKRLLLLRPQQRGELLRQQLIAAGWQVELAPMMQFAAGADLAAVAAAVASLAEHDLLLVVSPAVVEALVAANYQAWPCAATLVAVGQATAAALLAAGSPQPLVPQDARSEGLLQLPCTLAGDGRRALLLRGSSGRPLIADTLRQRGFVVDELACYQRLPQPPDSVTLARWQQQGFDTLVLTSCEALDILLTHSNNRQQQWLSQCQWLVASPRIAEHLRQRLAAPKVRLAAGASNEQLAQALLPDALLEEPLMHQPQPEIQASATAAPVAANQPPAAAHSRSSWWPLLALTLLLLVAVAVAGWWLWQQQQQQQQAFIALSNELRDGLKQRGVDSQQLELTLARERGQREEMKARLEQALQRQAEAIANLSQPQQQRWQLSEVAYLARLASRRLWYEQDVASAIALLEDGDRLLSAVDGPRILEARQALGRDLALLRSLPQLDIDGGRARLSGLQQQALSWPLQGAGLRAGRDNAAEPQSHFEHSWRTLANEFFTIHHDVESAPLLLPEQAHWLRENVRLALQRAQLSLQQRDADGYQAALTDVRDWLQRYFDGRAPEVLAAAVELERLAELPLRLKLPETLEINRLLAAHEGASR